MTLTNCGTNARMQVLFNACCHDITNDHVPLNYALFLGIYFSPSLPTAMAGGSANILLTPLGFGLNHGKY